MRQSTYKKKNRDINKQVQTCHCSKNKETPIQVFYCEFWEIFVKAFFTEHLRATAFVNSLNFSQSLLESANSVFVYALLE